MKCCHRLLSASLGLSLTALAVPGVVSAATTTPSLTVSANVAAAPDSCTFADEGLTFTGLQAGKTTATPGSTTITVTCTHSSGTDVTLTQSNTTILTEDIPAQGQQAATIDYKIFIPDATTPSQSTTTEWTSSGSLTLTAVGSAGTPVKIAGEVPSVPSASPAGDYSDSFVVTLSF